VTGKNARSVLYILAVVLVASVAPVMATDIFVDQIQGSYSLQLQATEAAIKLGGTNGTVDIDTETPVYDDDLFLGAGGDFSVCHIARVSDLYREESLSGGGDIVGVTTNGTVTSYTFHGSTASLTHTRDFGAPVDPAWVAIQLLLNADSAWVQFAYNGEPGRIQALMSSYGLTEPEATSLVRGDVYGLAAQLSQFGYSGAEVVNLALCKGIDYLRDLLAKLSSPYQGGPIDKAAEKYGIPRPVAQGLFEDYGDTVFVQALARSNDYKTFVANLEGWNVAMFAETLLNKTEVASGELIRAQFRLFHPVTGEQFFDPELKPYLTIAQVLPNGTMNQLGGYFSYIDFTLEESTGTYRAVINTAPDEKDTLDPGKYCAFLVLRNPANDLYSTIKAELTVT